MIFSCYLNKLKRSKKVKQEQVHCTDFRSEEKEVKSALIKGTVCKQRIFFNEPLEVF
jgi:hypothetical protein